MKKFVVPFITVWVFCFYTHQAEAQDRFAGLHLDFHAGLRDTGIGRFFSYELIDSMLSITKPDFIQVDCKGHPGISSYPTKAGNPAPAMEKDILRIWRNVTKQYNIPLYVHYSGIWDSEAIRQHPRWARVNADGKTDRNANSLFGAYKDSLLIPQIRELATAYQLDGIWVDGDCWMLGPDYSTEAVKAFKKQYGNIPVPRKPGQAGYFEWMEFHRKSFRNYITAYANAVHAVAPEFKVTSNWSFSSMMPEPVDVPVDYLSGDVAGSNSVYSSAFESRCLALQGKPWDLMSWSFAWKNQSKATKSVVQLQQEAAEVLAQGGGFQTYWQQNRDGSPEPQRFREMAEIIEFCRQRKPYTFQGKTIPQIGLLYSTYAWRRYETTGLYASHNQNRIKGVLNLLLDNRLPVDILMDHQLGERMRDYPLLIVPEWKQMDPAINEQLKKYVYNGGKLLVIGAEAVAPFAKELRVQLTDTMRKGYGLFAGFDKQIMLTHTNYQTFTPEAGVKVIGQQLTADDWRFATSHHLASVADYGAGKMAGIYFDMGDFYDNNQNELSLKLVESVIAELDVAFIAKIKGSAAVHQVITQNKGKLYVHLINTGGPHNNPRVLVYNKVHPVNDLTVEIRDMVKPKSVRLQPNNRELSFTYQNNRIHLTVDRLDVYEIIEVD